MTFTMLPSVSKFIQRYVVVEIYHGMESVITLSSWDPSNTYWPAAMEFSTMHWDLFKTSLHVLLQ